MSYASLLINSCVGERHSLTNLVIGTDGFDYYCIAAHTATALDMPITGYNYMHYWKPTGGTGAGAVWVLGTAYVATASFDAYGLPEKVWGLANDLDDVPCRLMAITGIELKVGVAIVIADYKLFLGDVTISEQDRVWVYAGTIKGWALYEILLVKDIQDGTDSHHKECLCRTAR